MRYTAYHGSPGSAFDRFDTERTGSTSGYNHASGMASFSSSVEVALQYAEHAGFVGRFAFNLENPLEVYESQRDRSIPMLLRVARLDGHDGVIVRGCDHGAFSPGEPSDLFFVFDVTEPRRVETIQAGPEADPRPKRRR
jgi:hypothetical protein